MTHPISPISIRNSTRNVSIDPTATRKTPAPARSFANVVRGGQAIVRGATAAMTQLPGGGLISAAVRGGMSGGVSSGGTTPPGVTAEGARSAYGGSAADLAAPGYADQGMQFLELQRRIAAETQAYSALSNVLKARHDTVKGAISNIR